ncbi:MAG: autotransporter outer membrane beta-barrel domain-containing protein [Thermoguttaceae bacterium]|nr:autotransporter outer membrane beta-barrel domain-containing protein [Thermoguttaceae bacterium]
MSGRTEDLLQFTGTNFKIGAEGETTKFLWKTNFGQRGNADDITITIENGTNIFDNQGIYMGSRNDGTGAEDVGGQTRLDISGGTNLFTQRVIVGGEGGVAGKSTINISGGTNIFTYDKEFKGEQEVSLGEKSENKNRTNTLNGWTGVTLDKYLGDNRFNSGVSGDDSDWPADSRSYGSVNMYNYYNNYYGVYFSAMAGGHKTEGVDLTISGGKNMFNVATYIGGGYDLTPYCSVNTTSNDDDVVSGGTNNVNITGGFTNFASRTYFGAQKSNTTVNFSGKSTTYFMGQTISEDMDLALANAYLDVPGSYPSYTNEYKGGDLPYVFLGGKEGSAEVNVNGFNQNMTTLDIQTSTFVGGAHETWLAGDQYLQETMDDGQLIYTFRDKTSGLSGNFKNGIRQDAGVGIFNLNSGKINIGYVNRTEIVKTRDNKNWNYRDTEPHGTVYQPTDYQDRYEQIRLIGAATGSQFNANSGRLQFEVVVHKDQKGIIDAAKADGYSGYFTDELEDYTTNANGDQVLVLEAGMIAFDKITIGSGVDITVKGMGKVLAQAENGIGSAAGQKEFYTNAVFVDTTNATYKTTDTIFKDNKIIHGEEQTNVSVDLSESYLASLDTQSKSTYAKTVYDKWLYKITLEDVQPVDDSTGIQTNQVRMHIETKGDKLSDNYIGNILNNADTFTQVLLTGDTRCPEVYDAIEQIVNTSQNAEEAAQNFDLLTGAGYASYAAQQIRRMSNFNSMMMDQILASDICLKNIRKGGNNQGDCGSCGSCGSCCQNWTGWGHFYGDGGEVQMRHYLSGYDTHTYGGMMALDWTNCESCHIGAFFDYAKMNMDSSAPMGKFLLESDNYTVGLYAKWLGVCCTGGYGSLIATLGYSKMESEREMYLDDSFKGSSHGILPSLFYERGWIFFPCERFSLNPFFNLQYAYFHNDDFVESGLDEVGDPSLLALDVRDIDHHSLRTQVGLRVNRDWMLGSCHDRRLTTRFKGAWLHDLLGACDPVVTTSHFGYPEFPVWKVKGNNAGRDWGIIGFGIDFNASSRLSFLFDYNCYVNQYTTIHYGMGTMRFSF